MSTKKSDVKTAKTEQPKNETAKSAVKAPAKKSVTPTAAKPASPAKKDARPAAAKKTAKQKSPYKGLNARDVDEEYGLKLFFQPIFQPAANMILGYECLLRIVDRDLGIITPDVFLGVAQKNASLMRGLEEWSMGEIFRTARRFRENNKRVDILSLNIDTASFLKKDFYERISKYFEKINDNICLELKEDAFFSTEPHVAYAFEKLRLAGIKIAVDDFTANFLTFDWSDNLPFDMIKIDRAYIQRILISPKAKLIVEKIIGFAKERELEIVAVGVESAEMEQELIKMGCNNMQGYYYSKPLQIKKLLENNTEQPSDEAGKTADKAPDNGDSTPENKK